MPTAKIGKFRIQELIISGFMDFCYYSYDYIIDSFCSDSIIHENLHWQQICNFSQEVTIKQESILIYWRLPRIVYDPCLYSHYTVEHNEPLCQR